MLYPGRILVYTKYRFLVYTWYTFQGRFFPLLFGSGPLFPSAVGRLSKEIGLFLYLQRRIICIICTIMSHSQVFFSFFFNFFLINY